MGIGFIVFIRMFCKQLVSEVVMDQEQRRQIVEHFQERAYSYHCRYKPEKGNVPFLRRLKMIVELTPKCGMLLNVGSGPGVMMQSLIEKCEFYVETDLSWTNMRVSKTNSNSVGRICWITSDMTNLPFASNHFDVVCCAGAIEYVPEWKIAVKEILRVTKPGGKIIITFANRTFWCFVNEKIFLSLYRKFKSIRNFSVAKYYRTLLNPKEVVKEVEKWGGVVNTVQYFSPRILVPPLDSIFIRLEWYLTWKMQTGINETPARIATQYIMSISKLDGSRSGKKVKKTQRTRV